MTEREEGAPIRVTDKRVQPDDVVQGEIVEELVEQDEAARALEEARAQAASYLEDLQRLKAEFENFRKRMARDQAAVVERASAAVVERLLPVLDNFELALLAADRTKDYGAMVRGVEMVYGELLELLHKEGLERIEALGKPFDPEMHEAVMRTEGEMDASFVVDEMRPGYKIGGRVVRPSMVKVGPASHAPETPDEPKEGELQQ